MTNQFALGVDVGGTNIRLAVVDSRGKIGERRQYEARLSQHGASSDADRSMALVLATLESAIRPLLERQPDIQGIGIGFPGFFDNQTGSMLSSPNIPGLLNVPLAESLSQRLGRPVHVQNDASLAALGEFTFGVGVGLSSLLHLTLGTGIGGGVIINGGLYTGDGGMAMEMGHLHVAPEDRLCGCGARGCMETWASASAVAERFSILSGIQANAREVNQMANAGNEHALAVLHDAGRILGRGIAEAVKLLDIRQVSISGGLTGAWKHLAPALQQELDKHLLPPLIGKVSVLCSKLGDDAGILGAAALALGDMQND
ncbi:MAG: transcriptional regulator [Zetaproteobacteria bacterium CG1_02_55_237]|nr:MAG: transcriptional regulator [Zetaproteobacteria bacterium CG1_02_55_237]